MITQISDREVFLTKTHAVGSVKVTRLPSSELRDGFFVPCVVVHYDIKFRTANFGETVWTYREVFLADSEDQVDLESALYVELAKSKVDVQFQHRSGSF